MSWSKLKQNLEGFLAPALQGKVEYRATSYSYLTGKSGNCYITVDKKNIFNMNDKTSPITWYQSEMEIKNDPNLRIPISMDEIEALRKETNGAVPEDRLKVMARNRKMNGLAKELLSAQTALSKSNFTATATKFLSTPIDESLEGQDILLNILALMDRRVGKKRILSMSDSVKLKHPIVQYFHGLRL